MKNYDIKCPIYNNYFIENFIPFDKDTILKYLKFPNHNQFVYNLIT